MFVVLVFDCEAGLVDAGPKGMLCRSDVRFGRCAKDSYDRRLE